MGRIIVCRAQGDTLECLDLDANTLDEATLQTGHGVYTVFRVYPGGRVMRLSQQLERLRRSSALLGRPYPLSDAWLRSTVRRVVEASGLESPRVRLTVLEDAPDTVIIAMEPFVPPPAELYEEGAWVGLVNMKREVAQAKDTRFIEKRSRLVLLPGMHEVLMVNGNGAILEGSNSNFFAVLDGQLRTAGDDVLAGIARGLLLEVADGVLPVVLTPVQVSDLERLDEALITSASRGVMPVVRIGEIVIGTGKPGPITRQLSARYQARLEQEMEPL